VKFLPHIGILVGAALVWYGRSHQSDLRIIGYIILAPALFGLLKANTGVDLAGKIQGGAPASGEALPREGSVSVAGTIRPSILGSRSAPPTDAVVRFGSETSTQLINPAYKTLRKF
jgi:hypothetical protein